MDEDDSIKIDIQKSFDSSNSPANIKNGNKSIDIFNLSKLYYKYLNSVNIKLKNSTDRTTEFIENKTKFIEYYTHASLIYEDIKKNWFWLENGEKLKYFTRNEKTEIDMVGTEGSTLKAMLSQENRKINLINNHNMLEYIAKLYGYDNWLYNQKNNNNSKCVNKF
jgi:hypothetical protein